MGFTVNFRNTWNLFELLHKHKADIGYNRKYGDYSPETQKKIRTFARSALQMLSGDDVLGLLNDTLNVMDVAQLHPFNKVIDVSID